ncbi:MAG: hypothetical protein OEY10_01050 [Nitrosopumilus sp.]|nr:hypothetical protein [Nitrosopumilus sp.]
MSKEHEVSIDEEIDNVSMKRPHVVILGAGASRATCLFGDKNKRKLPLMNDLVDAVGLRSRLEDWNIDPNQNFENIFSDLYGKNEHQKINAIEHSVENYFNSLELPDKPTVYDHLVLSLRKKDLIATFNWDPLLLQAYVRNRQAGLELPELAFLHGNVKAGYCEQDKVSGLVGDKCIKCGSFYQKSPLLYPIKKKDYSKNSFIRGGWNFLKHCIKYTYMITIFGYSGPKTDAEAIEIMKDAWGNERLMIEM